VTAVLVGRAAVTAAGLLDELLDAEMVVSSAVWLGVDERLTEIVRLLELG